MSAIGLHYEALQLIERGSSGQISQHRIVADVTFLNGNCDQQRASAGDHFIRGRSAHRRVGTVQTCAQLIQGHRCPLGADQNFVLSFRCVHRLLSKTETRRSQRGDREDREKIAH